MFMRAFRSGMSRREEENKQRKGLRYATLHEIEAGGNETAEIAELISTAVLRRHLETMLRLDIEYDFLPRESEILHLKFWDLAFEQLKQTGVLYFETEGKNKGCWVMTPRLRESYREGETDEDAKVIVRSNGTVTYVGKDIAYHLWKFGLLGRDFGYRRSLPIPRTCTHMLDLYGDGMLSRIRTWRGAGDLQRDRLAAVRSAGQCDSGAARDGAYRRRIAIRTSAMRWWR
jgi:arginyl-tRNA synthetase